MLLLQSFTTLAPVFLTRNVVAHMHWLLVIANREVQVLGGMRWGDVEQAEEYRERVNHETAVQRMRAVLVISAVALVACIISCKSCPRFPAQVFALNVCEAVVFVCGSCSNAD